MYMISMRHNDREVPCAFVRPPWNCFPPHHPSFSIVAFDLGFENCIISLLYSYAFFQPFSHALTFPFSYPWHSFQPKNLRYLCFGLLSLSDASPVSPLPVECVFPCLNVFVSVLPLYSMFAMQFERKSVNAENGSERRKQGKREYNLYFYNRRKIWSW